MFTKGKEKTLRVVKNYLNGVKEEKYSFIGARYDSPYMVSNTIPISKHVDDIAISKEGVLEATIAFRPVGNQLKELETFRETVEHLSMGEFPDTFTSSPALVSSFKTDVVASESVVSNIQEVPYRPCLTLPKVYVNTVTIARTKFYQVTIEEEETQTLTLLFTEFAYHGQTLLGTFKNLYLNRADTFKAMQFFVNGSLYSEIIGMVRVISPSYAISMFPLYKDITCTSYKNAQNVGFLSISCDTGASYIGEDDIKRLAFSQDTNGVHFAILYLKDGTKFELLFG